MPIVPDDRSERAETASLEARFSRLERAERRHRMAIACLILAGGSLLLLGAEAPPTTADVLRARHLVIEDSTGKERIVLGDTDGRIAISLRDVAGRERLSLALAADGRPAIELRDDHGLRRAALSTGREAGLNFYDTTGKLRAALGVTAYGPGWLSPARTRGLSSAIEGARDFLHPKWLFGSDDEDPTDETLNVEDGPVLKFYDASGKPRLEARVDVDRPWIFLHNPKGTMHAVTPRDDGSLASDRSP